MSSSALLTMTNVEPQTRATKASAKSGTAKAKSGDKEAIAEVAQESFQARGAGDRIPDRPDGVRERPLEAHHRAAVDLFVAAGCVGHVLSVLLRGSGVGFGFAVHMKCLS